MAIKRVLTVAGSDSSGGAGIQADLKTITMLGAYGMSVITAVTSQNTLGVQSIFEIPVEEVERQFDSVASDIGIDSMKTGMLPTQEITALTARKIRKYDISKVVVDPVMFSTSGSRLISDEAMSAAIKELIPLALVITPNIAEAEILSKMDISNLREMKLAAEKIRSLGAKNVVIKGGHLAGDAIDVLYDGRDFFEFASGRIETRDTHGTGCTFSAAIASELAKGMGVFEAVRLAKEYITQAIGSSLRIGRGSGPVNHMAIRKQ